MNTQKNKWMIVASIAAVVALVGCASCRRDLKSVDYAPYTNGGWQVSAPEAQGLDPDLVAEMYYKAGRPGYIFYGLTLVKNGYLVADFMASIPTE